MEGKDGSTFFSYKTAGIFTSGSTFGYFASNYINTLGNEQFYWVSHHRRPISNLGSLWKSLDESTWICFAASILVISLIMMSINLLYAAPNLDDWTLEPTDILLRLSLGSLEPHLIDWLPGVKAVNVLISFWLLLGISFNNFFNIDFRVALMTQIFPPDIESDAQIDVLRDGVFFDFEITRSMGK